MCVPDRNHDLMMAAWVIRLHGREDCLEAMLFLAQDEREKDTQVDARSLRTLLTTAGIEAMEVHASNELIEQLALLYAGERCCALIRMRGMPGADQAQWHLMLGYSGSHIATTDYQYPAADARYAGDVRNYMMGECVIAIKPVAHIRESWSDILKAIDGM